MSRFMETQVTARLQWRRVHPAHDMVYFVPSADYIPQHGDEVDTVMGYGVRESAPGYLDCTEWEVFEDLKDAYARVAEIDAEYAEDDDAY